MLERNRKSIGNIQQIVDQSNTLSSQPPQLVDKRPPNREISEMKRLQRNQVT